jgi:nitrogen regulatory protein P-II 1
MYKVECIIRPERLEEVQHELEAIGLTGLTVTEVRGAGRQAGYVERYRGLEYRVRLIAKAKVEVVVPDDLLDDLGIIEPDEQTLTDLVRESLAYLLDRETGDAIEHDVDLAAVADRFPDYVPELRARLGL